MIHFQEKERYITRNKVNLSLWGRVISFTPAPYAADLLLPQNLHLYPISHRPHLRLMTYHYMLLPSSSSIYPTHPTVPTFPALCVHYLCHCIAPAYTPGPHPHRLSHQPHLRPISPALHLHTQQPLLHPNSPGTAWVSCVGLTVQPRVVQSWSPRCCLFRVWVGHHLRRLNDGVPQERRRHGNEAVGPCGEVVGGNL